MSSEKKPLTKRQQQVLDFIKQFKRENDYMPTYKEIEQGLNGHDSAIHLTVKKIAEKGWILQDRRHRMMKLL